MKARPHGTWTPARIFMAISAVIHVPLAIGGLVVDQTFPFGPGEASSAGSAHIFGVFETNGWHSLGAVAVAAVSLYFAIRPRGAREAALVLGITHIVLFVSLALWEPETFLIASNAADQVVHSFTAIGGTLSGLLTAPAIGSPRIRRHRMEEEVRSERYEPQT